MNTGKAFNILKVWRTVGIMVLMVVGLAGCTRSRKVENPQPSVYYWRTTFCLSEKEMGWMKENGIGKMYLRLFDVKMIGNEAVPEATIEFEEAVGQDVEIVPTVFVVENVIRECGDIGKLAKNISSRIHAMAETNDFSYREVQIDCDWTGSSQERYFALLRELQQTEEMQGKDVSATIRLHQLNMEAPPVKYGALMVYNTGDFRTACGQDARNPILDRRDVEPYVKYLDDYPLPLCAAYPNFDWKLLFDADGFKGIYYDDIPEDSSLFVKMSGNEYVAVDALTVYMQKGVKLLRILPGDNLMVWKATEEEIEAVKAMVEAHRKGIHEQVIVYHLEEKYL